MTETKETKYGFKDIGNWYCKNCKSESFCVNFLGKLLRIYCEDCKSIMMALALKEVFEII